MSYRLCWHCLCYLQHMRTREHEIVLAVDRGCSFNQFRVLMRKYAGKLITSVLFQKTPSTSSSSKDSEGRKHKTKIIWPWSETKHIFGMLHLTLWGSSLLMFISCWSILILIKHLHTNFDCIMQGVTKDRKIKWCILMSVDHNKDLFSTFNHSCANLIPGEPSFTYLVLLSCDMQLKEMGFWMSVSSVDNLHS